MSASFSTHILDQVIQRRAREREVLRTRTLARLRDGLARLPVAFESVENHIVADGGYQS